MDFTLLFSRIVGPILLLRAVSIVLDRGHFLTMLERLEDEVQTISFSLVPIALFLAAAAIVNTQHDRTSLAAMLIQIIAWGALLKSSALILFPRAVAAKARWLGQHGILNLVLIACLAAGTYFTWFGYLAARG